jgi:uncharacterized protein with von Willebrand factor type A (vWA) domain
MDWLIPEQIPMDDDIFFSPEHMEILQQLEAVILRILEKLNEMSENCEIRRCNCAVCTGCGLCMGVKLDLTPGLEEDEEYGHPKFQEDEAVTEARWKSAIEMAEDRRYRDFREDTVLDIRQFQLAFRRLRQYSSNVDLPPTELDLNETIKTTAEKAGLLSIEYARPRKNTVKLIVLFDSDGSMWQHAEVSNRLFHAANKANHFKDLQFYYFHNCIYDHLYTTPRCINGEWIETEKVMTNLDGNYRVIYIGDAAMADSELFNIGGNTLLERSNRLPGIVWLKRMKKHYSRSVWLNPIHKEEWNRLYGGNTIQEIKRIFPMYELTLKGLEEAVKTLLSARSSARSFQ